MELKDSGARSEFSTGAVRDLQEGKGRMDLLPLRALREVSKIFEAGAKKYAADNWRKGIPIERFVDSGKRHLDKWIMGEDDEPHLAQACWNMLCLLETVLMIQEGKLPDELGQGLFERKVVSDTTLNARNRIEEMMEACQKMSQNEQQLIPVDPEKYM